MHSTIRPLLTAFLFITVCSPLLAADSREQPDDSWVQEYYLHPHPERFEAEVKKLQTAGALQKESSIAPAAAFFSRLFAAADPSQLSQWLKFVDQLPEADQRVFLVALRWAETRDTQESLRRYALQKGRTGDFAHKLLDAKAPTLDKISDPSPAELDMCWGAFFATGDAVYALPVIRCAAKPSKDNEINMSQQAARMSQQAARWSLKSLCPRHKKLQEIKDNFYKTATPNERKSLDDLFNK